MLAEHQDGGRRNADLLYWQSVAAKLYDIHAIPDNILVDPDGIIVARNLRGRELEHWLEEIHKTPDRGTLAHHDDATPSRSPEGVQ